MRVFTVNNCMKTCIPLGNWVYLLFIEGKTNLITSAVCVAEDETDTNFQTDNAFIHSFRPLRVLQHDTMVMTCEDTYYYGGEVII